MNARWLSACLLLAGGGSAAAQEDDTVKAVRSDFHALLNANAAKQRKSPPAAGVSLPPASDAELLGFVDRCWRIYDRSEGEPAEFDALTEILALTATNGAAGPRLEESWRNAAERLFTGFADDDRMAGVVLRPPAPTSLAKQANAWCEDVRGRTRNPEVLAAFEFKALQDDLSRNSQGQLDEAREQALVAKLRQLAARFGPQTVPFRNVTYAEFVKNTIYSIEHLKIGAVAPEIAAEDLDGVPFKLSDYRGKAVLLDFWGYW